MVFHSLPVRFINYMVVSFITGAFHSLPGRFIVLNDLISNVSVKVILLEGHMKRDRGQTTGYSYITQM